VTQSVVMTERDWVIGVNMTELPHLGATSPGPNTNETRLS